MKAFGRYVRLHAPGERASCARAASFANPTRRNVILIIPAFASSCRGAIRLVLHVFHRMFCPMADVRLQPCPVAAPAVRGQGIEMNVNRRRSTASCSHLQWDVT